METQTIPRHAQVLGIGGLHLCLGFSVTSWNPTPHWTVLHQRLKKTLWEHQLFAGTNTSLWGANLNLLELLEFFYLSFNSANYQVLFAASWKLPPGRKLGQFLLTLFPFPDVLQSWAAWCSSENNCFVYFVCFVFVCFWQEGKSWSSYYFRHALFCDVSPSGMNVSWGLRICLFCWILTLKIYGTSVSIVTSLGILHWVCLLTLYSLI